MTAMTKQELIEALGIATAALELIAAPARPDGTFNRCREACQVLAAETLETLRTGVFAGDTKPQDTPLAAAAGKPMTGTLRVFTDGGCKGNPGPSAYGIVIVNGDNEMCLEAGGYLGIGTNQTAELSAAIEGLSRTPEGATVVLISDSQYTLKGLTEWRRGWERNNWVTASKEPVKNQEYWKRLYALADKRKVTTQWVRGHSGNVHNERCDRLANKAIAESTLI